MEMLDTMKTGIQSQVMRITPEIAAEWIGRNNHNRRVTKYLVDAYSKAMKAGEWLFNGESIKISQSGELLDGQHRLYAVIQSKRAIDSVVITGLPDSVMPTVDVGKKRTTSDNFSMDGIKYAPQVAGAVTILVNLSDGMAFQTRVPTLSAKNYLNNNPGVVDSVTFTLNNRGALKWRPQFGAAHYLFSLKDAREADNFFIRLGTGVGLGQNEGVYRLRDKLIQEDHNKKKTQRSDVMAWFIKAWNAHRSGQPLTKLHGLGRDERGYMRNMPEVE